MNIFKIIQDFLTPVKGIIDKVVTTKEERLQLENELKKIEFEAMRNALDYEKQMIKEQARVIRAEAKGQNWPQRNWRPITMLTFLILVVLDSFGILTFRLNEDAWMLLQMGIGGYAVGRSAEKITELIKNK